MTEDAHCGGQRRGQGETTFSASGEARFPAYGDLSPQHSPSRPRPPLPAPTGPPEQEPRVQPAMRDTLSCLWSPSVLAQLCSGTLRCAVGDRGRTRNPWFRDMHTSCAAGRRAERCPRGHVARERSRRARAKATSGSLQAQSQGGLAPWGAISVSCPGSCLCCSHSDVILATVSGEKVVQAPVGGSEAQAQPQVSWQRARVQQGPMS